MGGGDELAIFLPRAQGHNILEVLPEINSNIEAANQNDHETIVCASLGLAWATTLDELATLYMRADAAMIERKKKQQLDSLKQWIESSGHSCIGYSDMRTTWWKLGNGLRLWPR